MTKSELISMYHECGGVLHRGSLKNLLKANMPTHIHFPDKTAKVQRIADLLNEHSLTTIDKKMHILCMMQNKDNNMLVQTAIVEVSDGPIPPEVAAAFSEGRTDK